MRERIAKCVIILTLCLLAALSYLFARSHNREARTAGPVAEAPIPGPDAPLDTPSTVIPEKAKLILDRGREVYTFEGCAACHSIAGAGNPRNPLDGAGARLQPDELEAWTTGTGIAAELLPAGVLRRKQRYRALPKEDLEALVAYLSSLSSRTGSPPEAE